jgi:hypothetical protein
MPNNTRPITLDPSVPAEYSNPIQQGFGWVTTLVWSFFNDSSYPVTSPVGSFRMYGTAIGNTASVDVSEYNTHVFQASTSGSGRITCSIQSSIDGYNWVQEATILVGSATSSITRLTDGRRRFIQALLLPVGATGSLYYLAGQS